MSVKTIEAVFSRVRDISKAERIVLIYLAHRLNDETGECFPTQKRISGDTELDLRTVKRALAKLISIGIVSRSIRKTHNGNGWLYAIHVPTGIINAPVSVGGNTPPSDCAVGGVDAIGRGQPCCQLVTPMPSVGGATPPDNKRKQKDSVCDTGTHIHSVVDNSRSSVDSSPFGIYDVEDAVRRLAVGDNPVPRQYIEERAKTLTNECGVTANGVAVTAKSFAAHCHLWWKNERNRDEVTLRQGRTHSRFSEQGGIPRATKGEDQKAQLCDECGCIYCVDGHTCTKGYVPPDKRNNPCRPVEKLTDGRYRCGCFSPRGIGS